MSLKIYVTKQHKESREINAFRVWLVTMEAGGPIALMMRPRKRLNGFSRAGGEGAAPP